MNGRRVWQIPDWDMLLWRNESTTRAAVMRRGCFVGAVHRVPGSVPCVCVCDTHSVPFGHPVGTLLAAV